ncbi:MAG: aromatic amino acid ammonia-lyase [Saprospiraceae bacterium]
MTPVGSRPLNTEDFINLLYGGGRVVLDDAAVEKLKASFEFLQSYAHNKVIYGINTGFGPMAQYKISESDQIQLQYNLIRSHASGSGDLFSEEHARAAMLARLNGLMQGGSGIHPDTAHLIALLLNSGISAAIFQRGGVGASGDLVQLAHLALNLIGEGEVIFEGKVQSAKEVFEKQGVEPLQIYLREGLALMNGTSAMTGVGIVNIIHAKKLLHISVLLSSITNELMRSFDDHFSMELNQVKKHKGQQKVAAAMRHFLKDSKLIRKRSEHLYHKKIEEAVFTDKVQEYYSLRCVPQILGPVSDTIDHAEQILLDEVNSVNDNPVIDHIKENVFHGGNFHGDYVSLEMDKLKIVISKLCMLAERQINYLLNDKLNQKLPPFINMGVLGLNFGLQGMQFTATSTTAENQTLSFPMYLHSIPNNNDNQDIVSMGCNAAILADRVITNTFDVLAIQSIALAQAIDYLKCHARLSTATHKFYNSIRSMVPVYIEDQTRYQDIKSVRNFLLNFPIDPEVTL